MSTRRYITEGEGLPQWSSPISHAVVVGTTCYVSGQLAIGSDGQYIPGTIEAETTQAFANFFAVLRAADFTPAEVVFVDIAFADLGDVGAVNAIFARLFPAGQRPARTIYQAAALPFGGKVKVTGVAMKDV